MSERDYLSKFTSTPEYEYPIPDPDMEHLSARAEPSKSETMVFYCETFKMLDGKKDLPSALILASSFPILKKIIPNWGYSGEDPGLLHGMGNSLSGELLRKMSITGLIHWYFSYFYTSLFKTSFDSDQTLKQLIVISSNTRRPTQVSNYNPATKQCNPPAKNVFESRREYYQEYKELQWSDYIVKLNSCPGIGILGAIFLRLKIIAEKIVDKTKVADFFSSLSGIEKQKYILVSTIINKLCDIIQYNIVNWIYNIFWEKPVTFQNILFAIDMDIIDSGLLSKRSESFNELIYTIYDTPIENSDIYSNILSKLNIHIGNIDSAPVDIKYGIGESLIKKVPLSDIPPAGGAGTERKYLKYKQKYIQLKNKLNNSSK